MRDRGALHFLDDLVGDAGREKDGGTSSPAPFASRLGPSSGPTYNRPQQATELPAPACRRLYDEGRGSAATDFLHEFSESFNPSSQPRGAHPTY